MLLIALLAVPFAGQTADSTCYLDTGYPSAPAATVWTIDPDLAGALSAQFLDASFSSDEVRAIFDRALQGVSRRTRSVSVARTTVDDCTSERDGCVTFRSDAFASNDECDGSHAAYAFCAPWPYGCSVTICTDNFANQSWTDKKLETVLAHELGHIYGLAHVNSESPEVTWCDPNAPACPSGGPCTFIGYGFACIGESACEVRRDDEGCPEAWAGGTATGCGGEVMCSSTACAWSSYYTGGDIVGLQTKYSGGVERHRRVFTGAQALPLSGSPALAALGTVKTLFPPRIDCAESTSPTTQCVAVTSEYDSSFGYRIRVRKLNGFSAATTTWTSSTVTNTISVANPLNLVMPPDITIDNLGNFAWVVYTTSDDRGLTRVVKIRLQDGAVISSISSPSTPVFPPRIAFNSDLGEPILLSGRRVVGSTGQGREPRWKLQRVGSTSMADFATTFTGDAETDDRGISQEYDFDCQVTSGAADPCVIGAILREGSLAPVDLPWSRSFTVTTGNAATFAPAWEQGAFSTNAIIGVTTPNSPARVIVSASRTIFDGTSQTNTRNFERSTLSFATGAVSNTAISADAESCSSNSHRGYSISAATQHGGYSIAYCPSCGTNGRLISLQMGKTDAGGTFCF